MIMATVKFLYCADQYGRFTAFVTVAVFFLTCVFYAANAANAANAVNAWQAPLATESLLLDIHRVGERLYAVGERGHILRYEQGGGWQQQGVPSRVMLTAVDFHTPEHGCATGHNAVIVCTWNGGDDWHLVHQHPELQTPLLDILFLSPEKVIAVGAYSLYLISGDGGRSWQQQDFIPDESGTPAFTDAALPPPREDFTATYDLHLNVITRDKTGSLYIAAEAGRLFKSADGGEQWQVLPSPYRGSWFGMSAADNDDVMVYGLRGHLYSLISDGSVQWQKLEHPGEEQLTDALALSADSRLVIGHGGTLLYRAAGESRYRLYHFPERPSLQAVTFMPPDTLHFASDQGILELSVTALQKGLIPAREPLD